MGLCVFHYYLALEIQALWWSEKLASSGKIPAEKRAILTKNAIFYLPFEFAFWICFFDFREQMDIICKNHRQVLFIAAINSGVRHVRSHSTD